MDPGDRRLVAGVIVAVVLLGLGLFTMLTLNNDSNNNAGIIRSQITAQLCGKATDPGTCYSREQVIGKCDSNSTNEHDFADCLVKGLNAPSVPDTSSAR